MRRRVWAPHLKSEGSNFNALCVSSGNKSIAASPRVMRINGAAPSGHSPSSSPMRTAFSCGDIPVLIAIERRRIPRNPAARKALSSSSPRQRVLSGYGSTHTQPAVLIAPLDAELGPLLWGIAGQGTPIKGPEQQCSLLPDCDGPLRAEAVSAGTGCDPTPAR